MEIDLLIKIVLALVFLLFVLIILFVVPAKKKKKKKEEIKKAKKKKIEIHELDFDELRAIIRRESTSKEDLEKSVDAIIQNYSKIPSKMGIRNHPDFDKYVDVIINLVRHKNVDKHLILKLDKALLKANLEYKAELNETLTKALAIRQGDSNGR